jgi:hypothetical protein
MRPQSGGSSLSIVMGVNEGDSVRIGLLRPLNSDCRQMALLIVQSPLAYWSLFCGKNKPFEIPSRRKIWVFCMHHRDDLQGVKK